MSVRHNIAGFAVVAAALFVVPHFAAAKESAGGDTVVATVNGEKILKKQVTAAMEEIPQLKGADAAAQAAVFPRIVDQIITEKLIDDATKKSKIEADADYKQRLELIKDQLAKQIYVEKFLKNKISDSVIKSEYEKFKKDNAGKQELRARQILVASEDEAKQVIKDLDGGAKFEDLAKQRSTGPSAQSGGEIPGYFVKEEMVPEISDAAFSTAAGSYTKTPIKSQFGWHVIKVEEKRARTVPDFKEVEMAIRNKLGQEALTTLAQDLRAKADVKLFDPNGKPVEAPKAN